MSEPDRKPAASLEGVGLSGPGNPDVVVDSPLEVLGSGKFYLALALPDGERVVKLGRPEGPAPSHDWRRRLVPGVDRIRSLDKQRGSEAIVRQLLDDPDFDHRRCFPDTRIVAVDVRFDWQGRRHHHHGWAYLQTRVEVFDEETPITSYDRREIVEVQKRLWRRGVGLRCRGEVWGPRNWSRGPGGEIRLADLSGLTRDPLRVGRRLDPKTLEERRHTLGQRQPVECRGEIDRYLQFIARGLSPEVLAATWLRS